MPQLGETVTEGTITQWFKQVGDQVAEDEPLFEVSTDKVDSEVPSPVERLRHRDPGARRRHRRRRHRARRRRRRRRRPRPPRRRPPAAEAAGCGGRRPRAAAAGGPAPPHRARRRAAAPPPTAAPRRRAAGARAGRAAPRPRPATVGGRLLSPVVRRLVAEHGLDPATIEGTGRGGRITRERRARPSSTAGPAAPAPAAGRRAGRAPAAAAARSPAHGAARRQPPAPLAASATTVDPAVATSASAPPSTWCGRWTRRRTSSRVDRGRLRGRRARSAGPTRTQWQGRGGLQPHLPAVHRPGGGRRHRRVPATSTPPSATSELIVHHYVNLGIAVDLDYEGLIVPGDPRRRRTSGCGPSPARSATSPPGPAARSSSPDDISGGTFTITNPGPFGTLLTLPIINQPQVAILSTDGVKRRRWWSTLPDGQRGDRHPLGRQPGARLGPPGLRRRLRRGLPRARSRRSSRPATGPPSCERADAATPRPARPLAGPGALPGRATRCSTACSSTAADDHLLLLEHPHVYTLGVRADLGHVLVDPADGRRRAGADRPRRRRHLPRARPARRLPDPHRARQAAAAAWPTPSPTCRSVEQLVIDTLADLGLADAGRLAGYPGRVGRRRRPDAPQDLRHRRAAHPGPHRCTASRSTSTPTWRCSATSCRAASPTRPSPRWPPRASTPRCARSSTRWRPGPSARWGPGGTDRADVAWRHAPERPVRRSAGATGPGDRRLPRPGGHRAPAARPAGRGRRRRGPRDRRAQADVDAGPAAASAPDVPAAASARCATSTSSPCARRPAARTSSSAGPTARPRS